MTKFSEAVSNSEDWLKITDHESSSESWLAASPYFQTQISCRDWEKQFSQARGPLGAVLSRTVDDAQGYTPPSDIPSGEYVIVTFVTNFENKPGVIESVTNQKQPDGRWAVVGYFIK
ncbi:DUF4019 domain-containing protein [Pontibacterium sp.]|uniref:DUF4019 domain-containing protein n=1 Tax=Pontibacterium sp. TaxID=2036026 RepID=UPI003511A2E1